MTIAENTLQWNVVTPIFWGGWAEWGKNSFPPTTLLISQLSIGDGSCSDRVIFFIDDEMKQGLL